MKKLLALTLLMFCCAPKVNEISGPPEPPPDVIQMQGVMSLLSMESVGHACPVEGQVYTAKHNVYNTRIPEKAQKVQGFSWEDGKGNFGIAHTQLWNNYYDLALLVVDGTPAYYKKGSKPESGEKVRWVEFNEDKDKIFTQEVKEGKVLHRIAGYIFIDTPPVPGASGSCLVNYDGEAVGVIVWGLYGKIGVAVELP